MLSDLEHQAVAAIRGLERVQDRRQVILELHVDDGADDLRDFSDCVGCGHVVLVTELERLGAGDDLDQFLGDHRLTRAVVSERLLADHLAGIARGIVHRAHARALLGGGVFQKRAEHLHRQIARQKLGEDFVLFRLVFVGGSRAGFGAFSNTGGMICCAVGICAITDLKREKNKRGRRRTRPWSNSATIFLAIISACSKPMVRTPRKLDRLDDQLSVEPAQLIVALAPDAEDFDLLAVG